MANDNQSRSDGARCRKGWPQASRDIEPGKQDKTATPRKDSTADPCHDKNDDVSPPYKQPGRRERDSDSCWARQATGQAGGGPIAMAHPWDRLLPGYWDSGRIFSWLGGIPEKCLPADVSFAMGWMPLGSESSWVEADDGISPESAPGSGLGGSAGSG
ncbi:hypothetical protein SODALDRAFT_331633 [Sodiomyces alkalinus F11]|uniref:Uncharacterized protein n=1 Tax=Sodiomyces alkalinus (strain CBS 110278 / VKM F-3762 / F11) TaxID=1314773 RepID=A0A3N2PY96_SODAK|nr:hypothetical protein SODALDRAFT_331633 [Sodiomyces alkalinus F11]ROT39513.1 hypothetical protein SODALDRAFT_331633 [Sodiomyces alkalinus F11]